MRILTLLRYFMIMAILLVPVWEQCDAATNPVYVDFTHTGSEDGTFDNPYNTLAEAIDAIEAGGEIIIKASTTSETLTITKEVTIKSSGGVATIGDTSGSSTPPGTVIANFAGLLELVLTDVQTDLSNLETDSEGQISSTSEIRSLLEDIRVQFSLLKANIRAAIADSSMAETIGEINGLPFKLTQDNLRDADRFLVEMLDDIRANLNGTTYRLSSVLANANKEASGPFNNFSDFMDKLGTEADDAAVNYSYQKLFSRESWGEIVQFNKTAAAYLAVLGAAALLLGASTPLVAAALVTPAIILVVFSVQFSAVKLINDPIRQNAQDFLDSTNNLFNKVLVDPVIGLLTSPNEFTKKTGILYNLFEAFTPLIRDQYPTIAEELKTYFENIGSQGVLEVTPATNFSLSGIEGGPFIPPSQTYTLSNSNTGGSAISFSVSKSQSWLSLSESSGSLGPGESTSVMVAINSNAASLTNGSYEDTVSFTDTTNNIVITSRSVSLTVKPFTWNFSATASVGGVSIGCTKSFTFPFGSGSSSFSCGISTGTVTVSVPGSFVVSGFGGGNISGWNCNGRGGGSSGISESATAFSAGGSIGGSATCTDPDDPDAGPQEFNVSGSFSATALK